MTFEEDFIKKFPSLVEENEVPYNPMKHNYWSEFIIMKHCLDKRKVIDAIHLMTAFFVDYTGKEWEIIFPDDLFDELGIKRERVDSLVKVDRKSDLPKDRVLYAVNKRLNHFIEWRNLGRCGGNEFELAKVQAIISVLNELKVELNLK